MNHVMPRVLAVSNSGILLYIEKNILMGGDGIFKRNYSTFRQPEQFQFISYYNYEKMRISTLVN